MRFSMTKPLFAFSNDLDVPSQDLISLPSRLFSVSTLGIGLMIVGFLLFPAFGESSVFAQEDASSRSLIYQPMGAPADPSVSVHWNRYHDYARMTEIMKRLAKTYPHLAELQSLGKSVQGREMWLMTMSNFRKGDPNLKPAFWIDGGIHGNEIQASEVSLYTIWFVLEMYDRNERIRDLLDRRTFYVVPMMNPDSREAHLYEANSTHSPRTGQKPIDDDNDGLVDEDPHDDLDGDGHITQMRIADPEGRWKAHEEFPKMMIRVEDGESGEYTLLGREGFDNDGDGLLNEDGPGSYDPNRDWPYLWQPDYVQRGAYRYPLSIPENRMVAEFIMAHPNIAGAQSFHNTGGMILHGPFTKDGPYHREDMAVYREIAEVGQKILPGYSDVTCADGLYEVYGGEIDWFHSMLGIFSYTNELFTSFNFFRESPEEGSGFFGREEPRHRFDRYLLFEQGLVPWHEVELPDGKVVEVGGMKKSWVRQPPSFLLEEECHRNMAFVLFHASEMPRVTIESAKLQTLSGGVREITVAVKNHGITPTHSAGDLEHQITPADRVTISGKDLHVLTGLTSRNSFEQLEITDSAPEAQKRKPETLLLENLPGRSTAFCRWYVQGNPPFHIEVISIKGGTDRTTLEKE